MTYRFVSVSLCALALCLSACNRDTNERPAPDGATVTAAKVSAQTPEVERAGYKSQEGKVFYYEDQGGQLTGIVDLGQIGESGDPTGNIKVGDRLLAMDGGVFAALTPGSQIVRVVRRQGMGAAMSQEATLPLDGASIVAVAMRDALAGRLTLPTRAAPAVASTNTETAATQSPGFDCKKAAPGVETMICGSSELSAKDAEVTRLYRDWVDKIQSGAMIDDLDETKSDQRKWMAERNKCADVACLKRLYDQRIEELPGSGLS